MSKVQKAVKDLIETIGDDPNREGLVETPDRVARFYNDFFVEKEFKFTCFKNEKYDEMITQFNIPYYSLCEHHMLPFFGHAHIAYIPRGKIVGLSKLSRALDHFAHRLQNQERLTVQLADYLTEKLDPQGVAVVLVGRHMCMEMRGICKIGAETSTSSLQGVFRNKIASRTEFLQMINLASKK